MAAVLLVEDDPDVLSLWMNVLSAQGHAAITAGSAQVGLQKLEANSFDLVVLDMRLPGTDVKKIKMAWPDVGVVCLSARGNVREAVQALRAGALDYLDRPLDAQELIAVVQCALKAGRDNQDAVQVANRPEAGSFAAASSADSIHDLEPNHDLMRILAAVVTLDDGDALPTLWSSRTSLESDLLVALTQALTVPRASSPPVFWAMARGFRALGTAVSRNLTRWAAELQESISSAAKPTAVPNPKTRRFVQELEEAVTARGASVQAGQLTAKLGIDLSYFSRLLKSDTGLTFRQWKWAILMSSAIRGLVTSDDHVRQIAFRLGYEHPQQFDRDFRRVLGMSPGEFRRLGRRP